MEFTWTIRQIKFELLYQSMVDVSSQYFIELPLGNTY